MKLVAGNSNRALAEAISHYLEIPLARCTVRRFWGDEPDAAESDAAAAEPAAAPAG